MSTDLLAAAMRVARAALDTGKPGAIRMATVVLAGASDLVCELEDLGGSDVEYTLDAETSRAVQAAAHVSAQLRDALVMLDAAARRQRRRAAAATPA